MIIARAAADDANDASCHLELRREVNEAGEKRRTTASRCECGQSDQAIFKELGDGHQQGSFPEAISHCGRRSFNIFSGFNEGEMSQCIESSIHLSSACAGCFAASGKYGFVNCKVECLISWCSKSCLECTAGAKEELRNCVGGDTPQTEPCE